MSTIKSPTTRGASFLSEGLIIHGNLSGDGDMRLSGNIHGEVNLKTGSLVVEESGYIEGDINVRELKVSGWVKGTIMTSERVEITATGKVEGSIITPKIQIQEGATLDGDFAVATSGKSSGGSKQDQKA